MFIVINEYEVDYSFHNTLDEVKKYVEKYATDLEMPLDREIFTVYEIKRELNVKFSVEAQLVEA